RLAGRIVDAIHVGLIVGRGDERVRGTHDRLFFAGLSGADHRRHPEALADQALRHAEADAERRRVGELELLFGHLARAVADPAKRLRLRQALVERLGVRRIAREPDRALAVHPARLEPLRDLGPLRHPEGDEQAPRGLSDEAAPTVRVRVATRAYLEDHIDLRFLRYLLDPWLADELDAA